MSVYRPYPNQQPKRNDLAPFQTQASGFYPFEGSTPPQMRAVDARAVLPVLGIAALLAPAAVYVPPTVVQQSTRAVASVQQQIFTSELAPFLSASAPSIPIPRTDVQGAAYRRTPWVMPLAASPVIDDLEYVVCGDATQPIAPYIRGPNRPLPAPLSVIAPLAQGPVFVVPPAVLARNPPTTYPVQLIEFDVAQFLSGTVSQPPVAAPNQFAAYLRVPATPVQQPESEVAPLIPQIPQPVFATPLAILPREVRAPLVLTTTYTAGAIPFVYIAPTPLRGLYARLSFAWPQIPMQSAALAAAAPILLIPISGQTTRVYGSVSVTVNG